jgi:hypothetical protein
VGRDVDIDPKSIGVPEGVFVGHLKIPYMRFQEHADSSRRTGPGARSRPRRTHIRGACLAGLHIHTLLVITHDRDPYGA